MICLLTHMHYTLLTHMHYTLLTHMHYILPNLQLWHFQQNNNKNNLILISFTAIHQSLDFSRHSCRFSRSSRVKLLYRITLTTCFSHVTSGRPRRRPRRGDQSIIRL
jgi:hypothetical protein